MAEPDDIIGLALARLVHQLGNPADLDVVEGADKVERPLRPRLQTGVDRDEGVSFRAIVDLVHVGAWVLRTLHRIVRVVVLLRV